MPSAPRTGGATRVAASGRPRAFNQPTGSLASSRRRAWCRVPAYPRHVGRSSVPPFRAGGTGATSLYISTYTVSPSQRVRARHGDGGRVLRGKFLYGGGPRSGRSTVSGSHAEASGVATSGMSRDVEGCGQGHVIAACSASVRRSGGGVFSCMAQGTRNACAEEPSSSTATRRMWQRVSWYGRLVATSSSRAP